MGGASLANGLLERLFWCVLGTVDYGLTQARLWEMLGYGSMPMRSIVAGRGCTPEVRQPSNNQPEGA